MITTSLFLSIALAAQPPTLMEFHSETCAPCRQMRPAVGLLMSKNYPVKSVDVDALPDLADRYKITTIPAFVVVDAAGKELGRTTGVQAAGQLARFYLQYYDGPRSPVASRRQSEPEPAHDEPPVRYYAAADPVVVSSPVVVTYSMGPAPVMSYGSYAPMSYASAPSAPMRGGLFRGLFGGGGGCAGGSCGR